MTCSSSTAKRLAHSRWSRRSRSGSFSADSIAQPMLGVVALVPPAVEDRAVERAVERRLHAARPAGFERPARRVQPHVAAVVHLAGDRHVVVGEEHEAVAHAGLAGELLDLLDQLLAGRVGGVRLAGEDELHRPVGVVEHRHQPLGLRQQQRRPLVGGETASEADRQRVGVEHAAAEPATHEADEPTAAGDHRVPHLGGVEVAYDRPLVGAGGRPVVTDHARQQGVDPARRPATAVHAVGDRTDRDLGGGRSGQSPLNIARLTEPWSLATPLRRAASRNAITAMLNFGASSPFSSGLSPTPNSSSIVTPHSAAKPLKYFSISARSKRSIPAGTGVCVVKMPPARTASTAASKGRPPATNSRMRSKLRKAAWPSLLWKTCGSMPSARSARTPPMPRTISWRRR